MIPKILHTIWLGGQKPNYDYRKKWIDLHPTWSFIHWTEDLIKSAYWTQDAELYLFNNYVSQSDYLRLFILFQYGGVYVDMDVEPIKPFDFLLNDEFFIGRECDQYLCPAVIGSKKNLKILYDTIHIGKKIKNQIPWGPTAITKAAENYFDITIHPKEYFFPYHWTELDKNVNITEKTFAIHHWNAVRNGFK